MTIEFTAEERARLNSDYGRIVLVQNGDRIITSQHILADLDSVKVETDQLRAAFGRLAYELLTAQITFHSNVHDLDDPGLYGAALTEDAAECDAANCAGWREALNDPIVAPILTAFLAQQEGSES